MTRLLDVPRYYAIAVELSWPELITLWHAKKAP